MLQKIKGFFATVGGYLLAALFAMLWFLSIGNSGDAVRDDVRERAEEEKRVADQEKESSENRQNRAERAEKKRNRFILPILILFLCASTVAYAGENLFIPDTYDELREYYIELWDLSEEYRALYYEAEASVKALQESNDRLQQIIADQQAYIDSLRRPKFGVSAGGSWTPSGWGANAGLIILF